MIICNKISDLIGELWITCQVITHGWLMARTHFLNITGSNALHDLFLFSIHEAMLFLAQAHSAIVAHFMDMYSNVHRTRFNLRPLTPLSKPKGPTGREALLRSA